MSGVTVGGSQAERLAPVLAVVLLVAVVARWLAYSGFFGSDEVTYTDSAFKLLRGDWKIDDYVGANRLGVNFPVAGFAWLLGQTELAAAAYSLLASLGEVALVTWAAYRMFGRRAALYAGLLMASLPSHVHFAGRLMADAPLSLTITAAFVLFYEGEARRWPMGFFLAGVCAGLSFWIKPVTLFVFGILLLYPLWVGRINRHWLWMGAGLLVAMAANGLLFQWLTGRFWYIFEAIRERRASGYLESGAAAGEITSDAHLYLTFLFGRIYHTGLLGYLALVGAVLAWRRRRQGDAALHLAVDFTVFWAIGLVSILSLLPVGFNPLIFVPKQTNYMLLFVAPLCLLGGYGLARMPARLGAAAATAAVVVGLLFALLLQGSVAVFTANSAATVRYVHARPGATFYVMSNAVRAINFEQLVGGTDARARVHPIQDWTASRAENSTVEHFSIVDEETYAWDTSRPFKTPQEVPKCWSPVDVIRGQPQGSGAILLRGLAAVPGLAGTGIGQRIQGLSVPKPARVYRLPPGAC